MLKLKKYMGLKESENDGMDSLKHCLDKQHFKDYSKPVSYVYNSRGFRDEDWPKDLSDVVWCVGDSFTVGLGQPVSETWPQVLSKMIAKRCLNLGEDGASNDTICQRSIQIIKTYNPKYLIIMWSFFHRRQVNGTDVVLDKHSLGVEKDVENFAKNFRAVADAKLDAVHLLIPNALAYSDGWDQDKLNYIFKKMKKLDEKDLEKIIVFQQKDFSRDGFHFDIETSIDVAKKVTDKIDFQSK